MTRRALVVGGSIGGLFTALLLRQRGWDVQIAERVAAPLAGRGAGIVTHPELWRILDRLGLESNEGLGVRVARRVTLAQDGAVLAETDCPQVLTSWDRLFRILRAAWPDSAYAPGAELRALEQTPAGVEARFADGMTRRADLLVGADGVRSAVRALTQGDVPLRYAGYVAWRGLVPEAAIPPEAHRALFDRFGFCLPEGEQMLGYPVAGEHNDLRPGHRRYNFVWYRPADEATVLRDLLTDGHGHRHALSIPPPAIRPDVVAAMRIDADRVLAPQFAAIVRATVEPFLQPITDLESPAMTTASTALVGDAAFVVRPHVGAGVTKAAEDAAALAEALDAEPAIPAALARYATLRQPAGRRIVARARHLGAYMQASRTTPEERAAAERHRTPRAVMAETALLNF